MTAPRLLSPFVRTRTRLVCTGLLLAATLTVASIPWWPDGAETSPADRVEGALPALPAVTGLKDEATAVAEALRTGKEVLVEKSTTATSQTWARPDGQLRSDFTAVPQRAKTRTGSWAPIDNTLKADGPAVTPVNPYTPVTFSNGSEEDAEETVLAEVRAKGHTITYSWPGPLRQPTLTGSRALYPEVRPGVDLLVVVRQEGGFGSILIVKNRDAAKNVGTLTYTLRSDTAVFNHNATTGGVLIADAKTGAEVGDIPTPMAWDAAGKDPESPEAARTAVATTDDVLQLSGLGGAEPGARHEAMPTRLDGGGTGNVKLHLDAAATGLLTGADVQFPVFLDPTLNTGEQAWLFVSKSHANSNFMNGTGYNGGTTDARVGHEDDSGVTARSFWRMAYANIKGATVSSATFKVLNNHSWSCTNREFQIYMTGAVSTGTTWNKQPAWSYIQQKLSFAHGYNSSCSDDYVSVNVKDAAQRAADAGATNITLGMRASTETDTLTWRKFQANTATLSATYNRKPGKPTDVTTTPGGTCVVASATRTLAKTNIVLKARSIDADGNLSKLRFRWWNTTSAAPVVTGGTAVTPDANGWASLTIATTTLTDKASYNWDVRAEDTSGAVSERYPSDTTTCRVTVDASAPPAPDVTSVDFPEATADGGTWSAKKFGQTGGVTFESSGATKFTYSFSGQDVKTVTATSGAATVPDLKPRNAGPNSLEVVAYDAVGNPSPRTAYIMYVMPSDVADAPGDLTGDKMADLLLINGEGRLRTCPSQPNGGLHTCLVSSYRTGGALDPTGHWTDPSTGAAALIAKHSDAFPGDGTNDLFARTHDGFWLYPGDGYGSFNVDDRIKIMLPSGTPAPSTWIQIKAVGDVTGDKRSELLVRAADALYVLNGYTGASFQSVTLMSQGWSRSDIVNLADVDLDGTPDLTWRHLDTGVMYVRHGKPGTVAGSVNLDSLKTAAASLKGSDAQYGTGWTATNITAVVGIPDVNGDKIPDLWARRGDTGIVKVYYPSATDTGTFKDAIITVNWAAMKGFA
ncbi:DNRLRE domain-containing protein [Actinoplanes sp. NPDC051861]|uniref:DNRLRE domain-containing protein n=1 Tax=Actinoplanes sp. NPDC051861 TaxID=3155170 RepID=UPI003423C438